MGILMVDRRRTGREHFDGLAEQRANMRDARLPLSRSELQCQKGGRELTGDDCLMCPQFRGWREGPGSEHVTILCHFTEHTPVSTRMTRASALVTVTPETTRVAAEEVARRNDVRHLLVTEGSRVAGILCRCDLHGGAPNDPVHQIMTEDVFALDTIATLGDAVSAMSKLKVGCLPVVAGGTIVGLITRGDLRRAGVPEQLLGAGRCSACSSPHGVRKDLRIDVDFCLDCLEARDLSSRIDLGVGD
jgi:hypothetical protein